MSDLLSLEEARGRVLGAVAGPLPGEEVALDAALGRVAARDVLALTDLPPWDNSAMDGYAIRSADVTSATEREPARLRVIGEVKAGERSDAIVEAGTAVRIATGAPLPSGADAVVPVEQTTPFDVAGRPGARGRDATGPLPSACDVHVAVAPGGSIRERGDDLAAGSVVLRAGTAITAADIAVAAGSGAGRLFVHRRPVVGVLATGDEVRAAGTPLGEAGIPDANGPGLRALVRATGAEPLDLGIAPDRLADVLSTLRAALARVDVVVVSGGVSVGPYDVVRLAFAELGSVELWRVAIQPGKPFAFGTAPSPGRADILLFGLPGNPVSSFVTFEIFVRPALRALLGHRDLLRPVDRAVLLEPATKSAGRRAFLRVLAERSPDGGIARDARGRVRVRLAGGQGSHVLSALAAADGLAVVPETVDATEAGAEVELWWADPR